MQKEIKQHLEQKIREWINDTEELPFYLGDKTVSQFVKAVEVVYDAKAEAAKLEKNNG